MTTHGSNPTRITERFDLPPSEAAEQGLRALKQAVGQALDRKRRLGQYAVIWEDGQVRIVPPEALPVWPEAATPNVLSAQETAPEDKPAPQAPPPVP
jgi:hypothetical protein